MSIFTTKFIYRIGSRAQCYKTFYTRNLVKSSKILSPWQAFSNIREGWKGLPGANTLAYYLKFINCICKKVYYIDPWNIQGEEEKKFVMIRPSQTSSYQHSLESNKVMITFPTDFCDTTADPGKPYWRERRLFTVDLLVLITCYEKKKKNRFDP